MNQILEDTLWKIFCGIVLAVWSSITFIAGRIFTNRWFRGMKITGHWDGIDAYEGWHYDFTAYLFFEPSEQQESDRDVVGFIYWKLTKAPNQDFYKTRPLFSTCYELVKGTFKESKDELILQHCGTTDKILITPSTYILELTRKRTKCSGMTTEAKRPNNNGKMEGSVRSR